MQRGTCFPPGCQLAVLASCDRRKADIKLQQQGNVFMLTLQCQILGQCQYARFFFFFGSYSNTHFFIFRRLDRTVVIHKKCIQVIYIYTHTYIYTYVYKITSLKTSECGQ